MEGKNELLGDKHLAWVTCFAFDPKEISINPNLCYPNALRTQFRATYGPIAAHITLLRTQQNTTLIISYYVLMKHLVRIINNSQVLAQ